MSSTTRFKPLTADFSVAAQIAVPDVQEAAAQGFTYIVNNRPDGEQPGQPAGDEIAAAAAASGLRYAAIPVDHSGFSMPQVDALRAILNGGAGRVLAYCRSGTRSTMLWALAQSADGAGPATLTEAAAAQGYDLLPLQPLMAQLRQRATNG